MRCGRGASGGEERSDEWKVVSYCVVVVVVYGRPFPALTCNDFDDLAAAVRWLPRVGNQKQGR